MLSKSRMQYLHVDIVNCSIGRSQEEKWPCRVVRRDGRRKFLRLPVLSHRVPDADLARGWECDELRPDEEQRVDGHVEVESANVDAIAGFGEKHRSDFVPERDGNHCGGGLAVGPVAGGQANWPHLGVDGYSLDGRFEIGTKIKKF